MAAASQHLLYKWLLDSLPLTRTWNIEDARLEKCIALDTSINILPHVWSIPSWWRNSSHVFFPSGFGYAPKVCLDLYQHIFTTSGLGELWYLGKCIVCRKSRGVHKPITREIATLLMLGKRPFNQHNSELCTACVHAWNRTKNHCR